MTPREKAEELTKELDKITVIVNPVRLDDVLYTLSEGGMFPDDVSVSEEQAIMCWRAVEYSRTLEKLDEKFRL